MKKFLKTVTAGALAATFAVSLTACGKKDEDENVLNAIRDFQLWYEENEGLTLESIFDDEGNFIDTIDEDTYEAIMSGLYSNK